MPDGANPESPPPPKMVSAPPAVPVPVKKRTHWMLWGCGALLALMLLLVGTVALTLWWMQRPIKPVVLSPTEKAQVEAKLRYVQAEQPTPPMSDRRPQLTIPSNPAPANAGSGPEPDRTYVPGGKVLKITEREINGLLNANTDLGNTVRLEFARDAINAYLAVPIPKDFPIMGGKMFRARGRFAVSLGNGGAPYAMLEDVTVFGLSLPKAWLGGLKGQNLLGDAMGEGKTRPVLKGIKSLRVEPGALVLEVED